MFDFRPYPNYSKIKRSTVASTSVAHRTLRARCSGELLKKFNEHKFYSKQTESEFLRTLIKEALNKREADSWAEEVKDL